MAIMIASDEKNNGAAYDKMVSKFSLWLAK